MTFLPSCETALKQSSCALFQFSQTATMFGPDSPNTVRELPFHTCSTQQEIVRVSLFSGNTQFGLGDGCCLQEARHDTKSTFPKSQLHPQMFVVSQFCTIGIIKKKKINTRAKITFI